MDQDEILIRETLAGETHAFGELMRRHQGHVLALVRGLTEAEEDAQDAMQEAFIKAFTHLNTLSRPLLFAAWLRQIARRECATLNRRTREVALEGELVDACISIEDKLIESEILGRVGEVLMELPELDRRLIEARYVEEISYAALERRHGLSYQNIAQRLFRARKKVRKGLQGQIDSAPKARRGTELMTLYPARKGQGEWGYIDTAGEWVIEPRFQRALTFSEGLGRVGIDGKMGYVDGMGQWAIANRFDAAFSFVESRAAVEMEGKWGFIDKEGHCVVDLQYDAVESFAGGAARVCRRGKWGFVDVSGVEIVAPQFDRSWNFEGDLAAVLLDGEYGYVDREGRQVGWSNSD